MQHIGATRGTKRMGNFCSLEKAVVSCDHFGIIIHRRIDLNYEPTSTGKEASSTSTKVKYRYGIELNELEMKNFDVDFLGLNHRL